MRSLAFAALLTVGSCGGHNAVNQRSPAAEFGRFRRDQRFLENMIRNALIKVGAVQTDGKEACKITVEPAGTIKTYNGEEAAYKLALGGRLTFGFEVLVSENFRLQVDTKNSTITIHTGIPVYVLNKNGESILFGEHIARLEVRPLSGFFKSLFSRPTGHINGYFLQITEGARCIDAGAEPGKFYLLDISSLPWKPYVIGEETGDWEQVAASAASRQVYDYWYGNE